MDATTLANNVRALFAHLRPLMLSTLTATRDKMLYSKLAATIKSTRESEIYTWLHQLPGMKEFLGERQLNNIKASEWQVFNRKWESTIEVAREDVERDALGHYGILAQEHAASCASQPDKLLLDALVNGFTRTCYTGKNFFDLNHEPIAGKPKFSNKDTKKISRANYRTARANMQSIKNANDDPWDIGGNLVLIVSPTYEMEARAIVESALVDGGNTNLDKGTATVEVWSRLAGTHVHKWFLAEVGKPIKPMVFQDEVPLQFSEIRNLDAEHVFLFDKFLMGAYARNNIGYLFPQLIFGSTGADAA